MFKLSSRIKSYRRTFPDIMLLVLWRILSLLLQGIQPNFYGTIHFHLMCKSIHFLSCQRNKWKVSATVNVVFITSTSTPWLHKTKGNSEENIYIVGVKRNGRNLFMCARVAVFNLFWIDHSNFILICHRQANMVCSTR